MSLSADSLTSNIRNTTFVGRDTDLTKHVYDLVTPALAATTYSTTTEEIGYKIAQDPSGFGGYVKDEMMNLEESDLEKPKQELDSEGNPSTDPVDVKIFERSIDEYVKDRGKLRAARRRAYKKI